MDKDLEQFLAKLDEEILDVTAIKSGLEKYGKELLSGSQKDRFFNAIYPQKNEQVNNEGQLGLKKVKNLSKVLQAMQELHTEGTISDEQIGEFLTRSNPQDGNKNLMTAIAMNTYATEFKLKKKNDKGEPIIPDEGLRQVLSDNQQDLEDCLKSLRKIANKSPVIKEAMSVKSGNNYQVSFDDLAARGNSEILAQFTTDMAKKELNVEEYTDKQPVKMGGDKEKESITVKEDPNKLDREMTVKEGKKNADKIADIEPAKEDEANKSKINFKPVKEQDIIDFMYNEWFLALINYVMEKTLNVLNDGINALTTNYDRAPTLSGEKITTNKGEKVPNTPANQFVNNVDMISDDLAKSMQTGAKNAQKQSDARFNYIRKNITNPNATWSGFMYNGERVHIKPEKIAEYKQQYTQDPEAFLQALDDSHKSFNADNKLLKSMGKYAAISATLDYYAKNPDAPMPPDEKAKQKIQKNTMFKMSDIAEAMLQISREVENEYSVKNGELSAEDKLNIRKESEKRLEKHIKDITESNLKLQNKLKDYYNESEPQRKEKLKEQIAKQRLENKALYDKYAQPREEQPSASQMTSNNEPCGLEKAAKDANNSENNEKNAWGKIAARSEELLSRSYENNLRKCQLNPKTNKTETNNNSFQRKKQGRSE